MQLFIVTIDTQEEVDSNTIQNAIWGAIDGRVTISVVEVETKSNK